MRIEEIRLSPSHPCAREIESLSRRRFCQHGRQPEVNRAVIDGE